MLDDHAFVHLAVILFDLYLAVGLFILGFAFMLMGKDGGERAARFYFGGSLRWLRWRFADLIRYAFYFVRWLLRSLSRWLVDGARRRRRPRLRMERRR